MCPHRSEFNTYIQCHRVFPKPFTHGGTSVGGQSVNGGTHKGGGANFDKLYHKLKVLLMLSCNYMMQFIGYNSIKRNFNSCSSKTLKKRQKSHHINNLYATNKKFSRQLPIVPHCWKIICNLWL